MQRARGQVDQDRAIREVAEIGLPVLHAEAGDVPARILAVVILHHARIRGGASGGALQRLAGIGVDLLRNGRRGKARCPHCH
ncbi:hypothetical protein D3C76_1705600 [compost metagenome]